MSYQFQRNRPVQARFHNESKIEQNWLGKGLSLWVAGAIFGLVGAFIFPLVVGLFAQRSAWDPAAHPVLQTLTTISALSIIPLLIFGGYCLTKAVERATPEEFGGCSRRLLPKTKKDQTLQLAVVLMLVCGAFVTVNAQQTVFNVPTTDVLDKGKVYFELDISAKPNDSDALNKFSSFVPRIVIGAGGPVEVGLNITGNVQPGPDSTTLVPAIKRKAYDGGDNGWAIAVGNHLFIPVRNKSYDVGNHSYLMVQKTFKTKTRIGFGGGLFTSDVIAPNAVRGVGQFTFEQPITDEFTVGSDWYTGKHANGYLTSGGYYKLTKKLTGYAAYSLGNDNPTKGNHFFYFELGYKFN